MNLLTDTIVVPNTKNVLFIVVLTCVLIGTSCCKTKDYSCSLSATDTFFYKNFTAKLPVNFEDKQGNKVLLAYLYEDSLVENQLGHCSTAGATLGCHCQPCIISRKAHIGYQDTAKVVHRWSIELTKYAEVQGDNLYENSNLSINMNDKSFNTIIPFDESYFNFIGQMTFNGTTYDSIYEIQNSYLNDSTEINTLGFSAKDGILYFGNNHGGGIYYRSN